MIGAVGEIIGAVAVVVSIVYLAIQFRANTRATRGQAGFNATHSWAEFNDGIGKLPDELLRLYIEMEHPDKIATWSEIDHYRMSVLTCSVYQRLEGQYFLYVNGILDHSLWEQRRAIGRGMIENPYLGEWWKNERAVLTFSEPFAGSIETGERSIDFSRTQREPVK